MLNDKNKKIIKIVITCIIVILILWFLILNPLIKFKSEEKTVTNAAKRYFEINSNALPTGEKLVTVSLQKLYEKDFISTDLKIPYSSKMCDSASSWVKVKKVNGEYKYYTYLKCGVFSSNIDHDGPIIKLKGDEEITLNKGDKYKDAGIESVIDNTDGKIDIKNVTTDISKVNTNRNGTYQVTYKIKDSFNNETIKTRTIKVIQILDKIVKNNTDKSNIYKGDNYDNYVKVDGITFKIVGLNDDGTVKIVSDENLASIDYNNADTWLNDYFYNKLSDSAKSLIVEEKWCNDKVSNPDTFTKCNSYSKKKAVGLLSVADINNSKDSNGNYNILNNQKNWTSNNKDDKNAISMSVNKFYSSSIKNNLIIKPSINLRKNLYISKGDGTRNNPYIIKSNNKKVSINDSIINSKTGDYIFYSGYQWRVIGKEEDNNVKIIMNDMINESGNYYYTRFCDDLSITYNPNKKGNIGFNIMNEGSKYVSTNLLENKKVNIKNYNNEITFMSKSKKISYKTLFSIPSMYDLYSMSKIENYWFIDYSSMKNKYCYMNSLGLAECSKYNYNDIKGIRLTAYLSEKIKVKKGNGTTLNPYVITK